MNLFFELHERERLEGERTPNSVAGPEQGVAFLFGVQFNQGQRAEEAWQAPRELRERLGTLEPAELTRLPVSALREPVALHPYGDGAS